MKINKQAFTLILFSTLVLTSCNKVSGSEISEVITSPILDERNNMCVIPEENIIKEETKEETIEEPIEETIEETIKERKAEDASFTDYLLTVKSADFRNNPSLDSTIIETIPNNTKIDSYVVEGDFYKINYNNISGYVHSKEVREDYEISFPYEYKKIVYLQNDTMLSNGEEEIITLPKLECLEVYEEYDDGTMLVASPEYVGYITSENAVELTGTFVVVDISDQELKLYEDGKVILTSPIVTGKPSTPTDEGIFQIYDITRSRYLIGRGYKSWVDVMMKYNGGEGLHDAEYHTCNGFSHGWRSREEFGGETYLTNGSHGCDNMPHEEAMEVYNHVEIGTKVLVKK